jgi:hypothetical protein
MLVDIYHYIQSLHIISKKANLTSRLSSDGMLCHVIWYRFIGVAQEHNCLHCQWYRGSRFFWNIGIYVLYILHGVTSQKTVILILCCQHFCYYGWHGKWM